MLFSTRRPFAPLLHVTWVATLLLAFCGVAQAQPVADRSEIEAKKKLEEEKERLKREAVVKETSEQREARERIEKKDANAKEALRRAQQAMAAANARQNQKGMGLMEAAWMLDPTNIDYPFNTGAFAEALGEAELEFRAMAAVKVLVKKAMAELPDTAQQMAAYRARLQKAEDRLTTLKGKVSAGLLRITSEPKSCEIYLDGAYIGMGAGEIDAVAGQRKAEARCPGYYDTELFTNVRLGDPSVAVIKPKPIAYFGKLIVKVDPKDGVDIFLDDLAIADRLADKPTKDGKITGAGTKESPFELSSRKWVIRFHKDGFDRWHRRIEVPRDQTILVEARLESLADDVPTPATPAPGK